MGSIPFFLLVMSFVPLYVNPSCFHKSRSRAKEIKKNHTTPTTFLDCRLSLHFYNLGGKWRCYVNAIATIRMAGFGQCRFTWEWASRVDLPTTGLRSQLNFSPRCLALSLVNARVGRLRRSDRHSTEHYKKTWDFS